MPATPELLIGDTAPDFHTALSDACGGSGDWSLSGARGQRLALCFFPADDLPGAIEQLKGSKYSWSRIGGLARLLGVSADSPEVQKQLIDRYTLPFALLSDPGNEIAKLYGLWLGAGGGGDVEGGSPTERATFVIDASGRIEAILRGVSPDAHAARFLELLAPC